MNKVQTLTDRALSVLLNPNDWLAKHEGVCGVLLVALLCLSGAYGVSI